MVCTRGGVLSIRSDRARQARQAVAALAILALLDGMHPALAAPPIADPGAAKRPTVDTAPNGRPVVQITDPSAGGVSRNRFTRFDVDPGGLILNNSTSFAKTQLGGYIAGNPNLSRSASVILSEVTGTAPSLLAGYLEVAGPKAEVVVANQNGITCNGCGFINVSRGTLTTGTPVFGGAGSLDAFRVVGGNISIEGAGLEASGVDQVDLLGRTLRLNAGIWAQRLEVVTGANQIWRDDLSAEPLTPSGAAPEVSLDVGALGGMYAGRIRLVGTERGVGVVSAGNLASTGDFTLSADGRILLGGKTTAGGALRIAGGGELRNGGVLYGTSLLDVRTAGELVNTGLMASRDATQVAAARITSPGTIAAGVTQAQELTAPGALTVQSLGAIDASGGTLLSGGGLSLAGDNLDLTGAAAEARGDLTLQAIGGGLLATDARLQASGAVYAEASGALAARGASILGDAVELRGGSLDLTRGAGQATVRSVGPLVLAGTTHLLAAGARLETQGAIDAATSGTLDATGAALSAGQVSLSGLDLLADGAWVETSDGQWLTAGGLLGLHKATLEAGGGILARAGTAEHDAETSLAVLDASAAQIQGAGVELSGDSLRLSGATVLSTGALWLLANAGAIDNAGGTLVAGGLLQATATGAFLNPLGTMDGNGVWIQADRIESRGTGAHIASAGEMSLLAPTEIRNEAGSVLYAAGSLPLAALDANGEIVPSALVVNSSGYIEAGGGLYIRGHSVDQGEPLPIPTITGVGPADVTLTGPTSAAPELEFTLPAGGIFHVNPDAGHPLIETDRRFTDLRTFLTSDYLLSRLPSTPEASLKRLGDGYYEEQLVLDQLAFLTGRKFLGEHTDAQAQYQALMDQGLQVARDMRLSVGVKLTDEQIARLTAPMVWMVKVNVDGHDVLVPKVYLPAAQAIALQKRGAIIAGTDLTLVTKSDVKLDDRLRAGRSVSVSAGSITAAAGTTYSAAKDLELVAERDIDLTATHLQAGGGLTLLSTGGDVNVAAQVTDITVRHAFGDSVRDATVAGSSLTAGGDIRILARNDEHSGGSVRLNGTSVLSTGGSVGVGADKDIELTAAQAAHEERDRKGKQTAGTVTHTLTTISAPTAGERKEDGTAPAGAVLLFAGRDATLQGAVIDAGSDAVVQADRNVSLTAVNDAVLKERGTYGRKYERTYDETSKGAITAGGGVRIEATGEAPAEEAGTGKVTTEGNTITANGGAVVILGKDVSLGTAREEHDSLTTDYRSKRGFLSSKSVFTRDEVKADLAVGTVLSGGAVLVKSEGDLTIQGAQIAGGGDVRIEAGKELRIVAAEDHVVEQHERRVSTGGVLGLSKKGLGVVIGDRTETTRTDIDARVHQAAVVGSVEGGLTVDAQGAVTILGSNLASKEAMSVSGSSVTIGKVEDVQKTETVVTVQQSGLSLSVRNGAIDAGRGAYDAAQRAREVKDDRLKALYALRAAREANEARKQLSSGSGDYKNLSLNVGNTVSESRTRTTTVTSTALGSTLVSEGDISVTARGGPGEGDGDLTIAGSAIQGVNVALDAARDLSIRSAENRLDESMESLSVSGEMGFSGRVGKGGNAAGIHGEADVAASRSDSHDVTHTESTVDASGQLTLRSGRDTTLRGATTKGETVVARVGRDLTIESEQDVSTYHSSDLSGHVEGTYGWGWSASATAAWAGMDSEYRSVQQQSGLMAGEGGYDVRVEGKTDLRGGVIASEAAEAKNEFDTGSLTYSNLENKSEYTALSGSITGTIGTGGGISGSGGVPIHEEKRSTTLSAVAPGTILTRSGEQDLSTLSRDPASATHAISNVFDRASVEERKELVDVFGQEAYKAVGDLAQHYTKPYTAEPVNVDETAGC